MGAATPRHHRTCSGTACHRTWACLVTLTLCFAICDRVHGINSSENVSVEDLLAEIQALKQQVAQLHGATAAGSDLVAVDIPVLRSFVPSTANLQRTLATQSTHWPQHWSFLHAVSADSKVTASHVMTDRPGGAGSGVFMVLGDAAGRLYFFTPAGHLLYEHSTGIAAAVTALSSQLLRSNSSHLAVGFAEGTALLLEVGHESVRSPDGSGIAYVTAIMSSSPQARSQQQLNETNASASDAMPITHISFTKSSKQRKMLLVIDSAGQLLLLLAPSGRIMLARNLEAAPLAININTDFQVVVQTPRTAVVVLLHKARNKIIRHCSGLAPLPDAGGSSSSSAAAVGSSEGDVLVAAVFDPGRSFRVYGVTAGGELVVLVVPSSQRTMNCKVVQRLPLGIAPGHVRLIAAKGRLVLLHAAGVAAFNITQPVKLAGSHLVSHSWQDMWRLYGLGQHYRPQQQQQQQQQERDDLVSGESSNEGQQQSGSCENALLHTAAWDTHSLPAAVSGNLLLLPLGETAVAAFVAADGAWYRGSAGGLTAAAGGTGPSMDWLKLLQPFVVVMMVVVGVWQFIRASNKQRIGQRGMRSLGAGYSSGLEGLGPGDLGELGMSMGAGLFGGNAGGFSGGLDGDFGPYAGPRSNREREALRDPYSGLGALGARRRARQIMHGRPERGVGGASRGLQQTGGTVFSMRGSANTSAAAAAHAGGSRGVGSPRGVLRRTSPGAAAAAGSGRRVTFEDLSDDSGGDDVGRAPAAMQVDHSSSGDLGSGTRNVVPQAGSQQHNELHDEHDVEVMDGIEQQGVDALQGNPAWERDDATDSLMQQMAAVGLDEEGTHAHGGS